MDIKEIIDEAMIQLQEDKNYYNFWSFDELCNYGYEGLREILKRTEINITETTIPLYTQTRTIDDVETLVNFYGLYQIPVSRIQKINKVSWKPRPSYNEVTEKYVNLPEKELQIVDINEINRIDPNWRNATTTGAPTHAVLYSGNYETLNMDLNPRRNNLKIKLYPTPTDIDLDFNNLVRELNEMEDTLNATRESAYGGLMSDSLDGLVWGIDTDGDGDNDLVAAEESSEYGIIVDLLNGDYDYSMYGNYPILTYIPDYDKSFLKEWDLDNFLPIDLQYAMREYICYRAFRKEGEAIDIKKAEMYKEIFEDFISEYRAANYLWQQERRTSDVNWGFGRNNNRNILSGRNYGSYRRPLF